MSESRDFYELQSGICRAIAHAKRLEILDALRGGDLSVGELAARTGSSVANVSQQLAVLRDAGVLSTRRAGTAVYYSIANAKILRVCDLMTEITEEVAASRVAASRLPRRGLGGSRS